MDPVVLGLFTFMLPSSVLGLLACYHISASWDAMLSSAQFIYWPFVPGMLLEASSFVLALGANIFVLSSSHLSKKTCELVASVLTIWCLAAFASFTVEGSPDTATLATLSPQVAAVDEYNRGYCLAWCRWSMKDATLAATGRCNAAKATAFDDAARYAFEKVRTWCTDAILADSFSQIANHTGRSPFVDMEFNRPLNNHTWRVIKFVALV